MITGYHYIVQLGLDSVHRSHDCDGGGRDCTLTVSASGGLVWAMAGLDLTRGNWAGRGTGILSLQNMQGKLLLSFPDNMLWKKHS